MVKKDYVFRYPAFEFVSRRARDFNKIKISAVIMGVDATFAGVAAYSNIIWQYYIKSFP